MTSFNLILEFALAEFVAVKQSAEHGTRKTANVCFSMRVLCRFAYKLNKQFLS